jgi:multidrug resistance protein
MMKSKDAVELSPQQQKVALGLLFGVLLLVMMGFSVLFPIEASYIRHFGADVDTMGWIVGVYSLMQFIFAPLWGQLSDRIGRRPVLMAGLVGYVIAQVWFGMASQIWMLFAARMLGGVLSAATMPTAMAYISDITPPEERAKGMGILGAAFGLGVIFGPGLGGSLGQISLSLPFFVSAGLAALALGGVLAFLPESLPAGKRSVPHETKRVSRWSAFSSELAALYGVTLALSLGIVGLEVTFSFFAQDRLHLNPQNVGWIFVTMGIVGSFVQGFLVGKLTKRWGEVRMTLVGLSVGVLGMIGVALSSNMAGAIVAICLLSIGTGIARPANSSLISRRATVGQGVAIGLMDSFDSLGRIIGPLLGGYLYKVGTGMPYFSGALLLGVALALSAFWARSMSGGLTPGAAIPAEG